jgi:hypothetical protein
MRRLVPPLFALMMFSSPADELPPPESERSRVQKIAAVVEAHAETVGCNVHVDPASIVPYRVDQEFLYLAYYAADIGCSGGTAMSRPVIVAVKPGAYGRYFIDSTRSSPAQTSDAFPRHITRIALVDGDLRYEARRYDDGKDALCCPSLTERGRVVFENGMWRPRPVDERRR